MDDREALGGFTKLFNRILTSSIWSESNQVRIVWITLLAASGPDGVARTTLPGLARFANLPIDETERAVAVLMAPDQYSRTVEHDGRRIREQRDSAGNLIGYFIYNYSRHRSLDSGAAERQRRYRQRQKGPIIARIVARDGERCGICSESVDPAMAILDHIVPRSAGGLSILENYQLAHPSCNGAKCDGRGGKQALRCRSMPDVASSRVTNASRHASQKTEVRRQKSEDREKQRKRTSGNSTDSPESRAVLDDFNATTGRRLGYPGNVELVAKALESGVTAETMHRVFVAVRDKSTPAAKWWAEEHKGLDWLLRTTYRRPSDGQTMQGGLVKIPNELDECDRAEREAAMRKRRGMIAHGHPVDPPATPEEIAAVRGDA